MRPLAYDRPFAYDEGTLRAPALRARSASPAARRAARATLPFMRPPARGARANSGRSARGPTRQGGSPHHRADALEGCQTARGTASRGRSRGRRVGGLQCHTRPGLAVHVGAAEGLGGRTGRSCGALRTFLDTVLERLAAAWAFVPVVVTAVASEVGRGQSPASGPVIYRPAHAESPQPSWHSHQVIGSSSGVVHSSHPTAVIGPPPGSTGGNSPIHGARARTRPARRARTAGRRRRGRCRGRRRGQGARPGAAALPTPSTPTRNVSRRRTGPARRRRPGSPRRAARPSSTRMPAL